MNNNNKTVRVYDTINKKYVDVEVSEEIYKQYQRTQWNIDDNNESFYKHEIQFSMLKLGASEDVSAFLKTPNFVVYC